jgi:hypothetical protein
VRASGQGSLTDSRNCRLPVAQWLARYASLVDLASLPGTPQAWTRRLLRCGVVAGPAPRRRKVASDAELEAYVKEVVAAQPPLTEALPRPAVRAVPLVRTISPPLRRV